MNAAQLLRWALSQSYLKVSIPVEGVLAGLAAAGVVCDTGGGRVSYDMSAALAPLDVHATQVLGLGATLSGDAAFEEFDGMGLQEDLLRGIYSCGFERPSEIQRRLGPMLRGRNLIARAESGTGKTAALAIGVLHLVDCRRRASQALILTSGREQAVQTQGVVVAIGCCLQVSCHSCIGGTSVRGDVGALRREPHVVVGTAGRVGDMVAKRHLRTRHVRVLVLDEADALLRGGAGELAELRRSLPRGLQLCFLSATMPPLAVQEARRLCRGTGRETAEVGAGARVPSALQHFRVELEEEDWKLDTLCDLYESIAAAGQGVVFCNTRRRADFLCDQLSRHRKVVSCLHAELDQRERDLVLREFRAGQARVLITADLLERGIDVQQVNLVINYDVPPCADSYVHRAARAGRFHRPGVVISFATPGDGEALEDIERRLGLSVRALPVDFAELARR